MNQQRLAYEIAKKEIGVTETPGILSTSRILEYDLATTLKSQSDETPWCSAFVNWCFIVAGLIIDYPGTYAALTECGYTDSEIDPLRISARDYAETFAHEVTSGVVVMPTRSALARHFLTWGIETENPVEGDLVVLKRRGAPLAGHVGFYVAKSKLGVSVTILGGNQNDTVCLSNFMAFNILGYRTLNSDQVQKPSSVPMFLSASLSFF